MTFYYETDTDRLVGNNMFYEYEYGTIAQVDGESLFIDVETIMEDGRGINKLKEMRSAIDDAIEAHEEFDDNSE